MCASARARLVIIVTKIAAIIIINVIYISIIATGRVATDMVASSSS